MIQQTSMEAYESIKHELGERQQLVLDTIVDNPGMSNHDIAHILGLEINQVTGRVFELRTMGLVKSCGLKLDEDSGRNVIIWKEA